MNRTTTEVLRKPRGPIGLMYRMYRFILPDVYRELARWRKMAGQIPDPELRSQAIASLTSKQFHCEGGSVYAAAAVERRKELVPLIVALQTISDYLDNLCDRSTSLDPDDFRLLHQSMLDAVNPDAEPADYYALRQEREDGGYLEALVRTCQDCIRQLPGYGAASRRVSALVGLYGDLQVYKHIRKDQRLPSLHAWWETHRGRCAHLKWNEFAAATGSTLGMFMLFVDACRADLTESEAQRTMDAYFPHMCGLHILLDYLIDQEEDRLGGDLNFCNYYESRDELLSRLAEIAGRARQDAGNLPDAAFHRMVVEGLMAVYLSDPKAWSQPDVREVARSIMRHSPLSRLFFWVNTKWVRRRGKRRISQSAESV